MKRIIVAINILLLVWGSKTSVQAQTTDTERQFRPEVIVEGIDRPEGMAVIDDVLYISHYHADGGIYAYDLATQVLTGKVADGLHYPSGLLALNGQLVVLEYGSGSIYIIDPKTGRKDNVATGFSRPADIVSFGEFLFVSDFATGTIYRLDPETFSHTVYASGLAGPAGLAILEDKLHVVEWSMGRVSRIHEDGRKQVLVAEDLSSPWGLMVYENELYVSETGSDQLSRIAPVTVPVADHNPSGPAELGASSKEEVIVWKVFSMRCKGLDHPEALYADDRGIYVSEWQSHEVSKIHLNSPPSGAIAITGKTKIGQSVAAEPQEIEDEDGLGPFTYSWQWANHYDPEHWEDLDMTKQRFKLKKRELAGIFIRATLSYTDGAGYEESIHSEPRLVTKPLAPMVRLSIEPEELYEPGDTVTLTAELTVMDEDAHADRVELIQHGQLLLSLENSPYQYRFVVQDKETDNDFIDPFTILARGYDSNGSFGEDRRTLYVANEGLVEDEWNEVFRTSGRDMLLFPNPVMNTLNILHRNAERVRIRLIDAQSSVVVSTELVQGTGSLDLSELAAGTYIVEYTVDGVSRAERIVKIK